MKRLLICGATGFIGRNLAERLVTRDDFKVMGVWHRREPFELSGLDWIQADLTDPAQVKQAVQGADIVIQAAATTSGAKEIVGRPQSHVTDNAVMNSLLLREAFEAGVGHTLFFSCSIMYPSRATPLAETDFAEREIHPRYFGAAWTKVYVEKLCEFYAGLGGGKFTVVRHSNVYGPHDKFDLDRSHVTGATITKVMTARDGRLAVWGDGEETRDLIYVDDLVDFVEAALARQPHAFGLYNCGGGAAVSVRDLVQTVMRLARRELAVDYDPGRPTIKTRIVLDSSKALLELGWRPATPLESGLAQTIDWWRKHVRGTA